MKRFIVLAAFLPLAACTNALPPDDARISVVTSFYPPTFLAERIVGNEASVLQMVPAGAEPHDFEPTPRDIASVHTSDLFIMNGAGVDAWADSIKDELLAKEKRVIVLTEGVELLAAADGRDEHEEDEMHEEEKDEHHEDSHEHGPEDPHVWLDPLIMRDQAERIRDSLIAADPQQQEIYMTNAAQLIEELTQLDSDFRTGLADCTLDTVIVSHDAFRYLAGRYGFETLPIAGLSPVAEPSLQTLGDLSDRAREQGIKHVFFETLVSPRLAETLADEIGAQTLVLNPLEGLIPADRARGADYLSLMYENLQNLRTALQCR